MLAKSTETIAIIGGAIIGSSVAYFLRELGFTGRIIVVERDRSYSKSSTALSAAAIRTQFECAVNIRMSLFGAEFFRNIKNYLGPDADIGFVERGYLILGVPESTRARRDNVEMQNAEGAHVVALTPSEAQSRFPWLNTDDIGVATVGVKDEGSFDAWSLLTLMRRAAQERGVTYIEDSAESIETRNERVVAVRLASGEQIAADWCINAAGATSAAIVRDLNIEIPIVARKRTAFSIKSPLDVADFPMVFDTTGAWIRRDGQRFITGIAPTAENDPDVDGDFEPAYEVFENVLWPALAHRIPALEELRMESAWAGHYEINTLDHNGIVGLHDGIVNLVFATGFSGHGVMHAPAVGRGIAELLITGAYRTIDLSQLGFGRIRSGLPIHETAVY